MGTVYQTYIGFHHPSAKGARALLKGAHMSFDHQVIHLSIGRDGTFPGYPEFTDIPHWITLLPMSAEAYRLYCLLKSHIRSNITAFDLEMNPFSQAHSIARARAAIEELNRFDLVEFSGARALRVHFLPNPQNKVHASAIAAIACVANGGAL